MTDEELIARLRTWDGESSDVELAADRIEALLSELASGSFYKEADIDALQCRASAAEAKLAKAMEVLREIEKRASETNRLGAVTGGHWTHLTIACLTARAALADLEKPND